MITVYEAIAERQGRRDILATLTGLRRHPEGQCPNETAGIREPIRGRNRLKDGLEELHLLKNLAADMVSHRIVLGRRGGVILHDLVAPLGSGFSGLIEDRQAGLRLYHRSVGRSNCQRAVP